ncbi:hypothetical protein, conserved [Plasmodium gonderi]|uniref:Uncharacterized protein n=1 Tax=Plasmodium gonderi TaxID=77519 RepID=A0A1Y1JEQ8_PLAGO|nr:hypothetical protein, conserved [Plasmodium gonderi]GAW81011.1 hypothetical protein, conserved [Plasmodium gonderi]
MNEKNDSELRNSDNVNDASTVKEKEHNINNKTNEFEKIRDSFDSADSVDSANSADSADSKEKGTSECVDTNDKSEQKNDEVKTPSFFTKCVNKIKNFNSATSEGDVDMEVEKMGSSKDNEGNTNCNDNEESGGGMNLLSKEEINPAEQEKTMVTIPQNCELQLAISAISTFHKNKTELNLDRGEIYLNENELALISYHLSTSGFRFFPIDDTKKKKKRELSKLDELIVDTKRIKSDHPIGSSFKRDGSYEGKKIEIGDRGKNEDFSNADENVVKCEIKTGGSDCGTLLTHSGNVGKTEHTKVYHYAEKQEDKSERKLKEYEDDIHRDSTLNEMKEKKSDKTSNYLDEDAKKELEDKEKIELCDEILTQIKNSFYDQILNIENNFKNLDNKIEDNNCFYFQCIMEKLKNKKYENTFLIYNDVYLYLNNLLFMSKPSSYIWMKLHELSTQITNSISDIQQRKKDKAWIQTIHNVHHQSMAKEEMKKEKINSQDTIEQSINEEEKLAFQLLLGKLHQDIHFELFRKFKNKAVWKTLEGGEIELDDKLTKADVFREMYNWCKDQLELKSKQSDSSESESDSSKDSY